MSRFLPEFENVLRALADEHRRLLAHVESQQAAMKAFNLKAMDEARNQQEASRLRVASLEAKRRTIVLHMTKGVKLDSPLTLTQIADLHPPRRQALLGMRDEIKQLAQTIATRSHIAALLAYSVLR